MTSRPCPACGGPIGNARGTCGTCNRFAARVRTTLLSLLRSRHPSTHAKLKRSAERKVYDTLVAQDHRSTAPGETP